MEAERIRQQIQFIREIDELKHVLRQSYLMNGSRRENDAEHTWHIAVMALLLQEHAADQTLDVKKVVHLLLIHDLVEIDTGDTFAYDTKGYEDKWERELAAAKRIFGLLPADQREAWMALWIEFEEGQTAEARYAAAIDRLHPVLHNFYTEGKAWKAHHVSVAAVKKRMAVIAEAAPALGRFVDELLEEAVAKGYLLP
ncbi:HD domain-containing protein [Paenibacillus sacheonensis]|uniref:HD domain-containing protein n=1 Tax=Paenibacillus sacheonensis TaxID=742054 RepID=A0A7X4YU20_9BACL|nr:HD domain-containing protein [Paenibacillus sacheonensis]NBC72562.1 HD domain-containing protein [Paenibacillus sacheonensis]